MQGVSRVLLQDEEKAFWEKGFGWGILKGVNCDSSSSDITVLEGSKVLEYPDLSHSPSELPTRWH